MTFLKLIIRFLISFCCSMFSKLWSMIGGVNIINVKMRISHFKKYIMECLVNYGILFSSELKILFGLFYFFSIIFSIKCISVLCLDYLYVFLYYRKHLWDVTSEKDAVRLKLLFENSNDGAYRFYVIKNCGAYLEGAFVGFSLMLSLILLLFFLYRFYLYLKVGKKPLVEQKGSIPVRGKPFTKGGFPGKRYYSSTSKSSNLSTLNGEKVKKELSDNELFELCSEKSSYSFLKEQLDRLNPFGTKNMVASKGELSDDALSIVESEEISIVETKEVSIVEDISDVEDKSDIEPKEVTIVKSSVVTDKNDK